MRIRSYRDLEVWKNGIEIADLVYDVTQAFPREERYELASHMRKTGVSIPSNVAEGHARHYRNDYVRFCYYSLGSVAELDTQMVVASRRDYLTHPDCPKLWDALESQGRMLNGLITKLKR